MPPKQRKRADLDAHLDDSTDFDAPSLRALDHSLRCALCGELFTAPVLLTPCSHAFDSLCLREHLAETKRCPVCHFEANEDRIKPVHQLEEAVRNWKAARSDILALQAAAAQSRPSNAAASSSSSSLTPAPGPSRASSSSFTAPNTLGTKFPPYSDRKGKRKAVDPPNGKTKKTKEVEELTLADSDDDDVVIEGQSPPRKKLRNGKERAKTPKREEQDEADQAALRDPEDPNLIVSCPICASSVKNAHIATHIDSGCKKGKIKPGAASGSSSTAAEGGGKSAWSKLMSSGGGEKGKAAPSSESEVENEMDTTQPLPLKSYTGKSVKELSKMLTDWHLTLSLPSSAPSSTSTSTSTSSSSTTSSTLQIYIARHQHFTRLWNANADVPHSSPAHKSARELRRALEEWERGREEAGRKEEKRGREKAAGAGDKETKEQWLALIAQARASALAQREQQKAAPAAAPAPEKDVDVDMADAAVDAASSITVADEPAAAPPAHPSPPGSPPPPPPPKKRTVRIVSPVRSSPPPPAALVSSSASSPAPHNLNQRPRSRSPSLSPPSFLRDEDEFTGEEARWSKREKGKKREEEKSEREKERGRERETSRDESPFDPEPPRPSQRNREEERMFAELAAERGLANGADEDDDEE
ncbi:hypothetical protein JCM6882_008813 [Rhodosporidiobolus microsporus]